METVFIYLVGNATAVVTAGNVKHIQKKSSKLFNTKTMNTKILAQNIVNNPGDFTAEEIEKYFEKYAELHTSSIASKIQEWIRSREKDIEFSRRVIVDSDGATINLVELNVKLIKEAEIRIAELNAVLECFL